MTFSNWFASRRSLVQQQPKLLQTHRLLLEALEDRTVPTVTLGTALSIGHELDASRANDVAADAAGNSYMTGSFSGITDFDPAHSYPGDTDILVARGTQDAFVAKYAPDNSLVWVKRMGGDTSDIGKSIAIDGSGNVYIVGDFSGTADFGSTGLSSAGSDDGFVAKLNSSGNFLWARRWGTASDETALGIDVDAGGNVYVLGFRHWEANDILKFNSSGNAVWSQSIVVTNTSISYGDIAVDANGNVFVCGAFDGVRDFDPSNKTYYVAAVSSYNAFVLKLTTQGKFSWVSTFPGQTVAGVTGYSHAQSIALDGSGNVIVGGYYGGTVDFNPGSGTTNLPSSGRGFITKLTGSGGLVWAKALVSDNTTFVNGLAVDSSGGIYATGTFYGTVDFDPGAGTSSKTTAGGTDIYVMKLDASGNYQWAESFGSSGNDYGGGIDVDPSGTVHLAGGYRGVVDFDPNPTDVYFLSNPGTYSNLFLVRLRQS